MTTEIVSVFTTLSHPTRSRKSVDCWAQFMDIVEIFFPTYNNPPASIGALDHTDLRTDIQIKMSTVSYCLPEQKIKEGVSSQHDLPNEDHGVRHS